METQKELIVLLKKNAESNTKVIERMHFLISTTEKVVKQNTELIDDNMALKKLLIQEVEKNNNLLKQIKILEK